ASASPWSWSPWSVAVAAEGAGPDWGALPGAMIPLPGAALYYEPGFIADGGALFEQLQRQAAWRQEPIRLVGKAFVQSRLVGWYGDPGAGYGFSGLGLVPLPWLAPLQTLRQRLERHLGSPFNSGLLNWYRDGRDSMGLHADAEPELGAAPVIASVSL